MTVNKIDIRSDQVKKTNMQPGFHSQEHELTFGASFIKQGALTKYFASQREHAEPVR